MCSESARREFAQQGNEQLVASIQKMRNILPKNATWLSEHGNWKSAKNYKITHYFSHITTGIMEQRRM